MLESHEVDEAASHPSNKIVPPEEWRKWTAADGRKAQEATFLSCDNGIVQVLTRSGQRAQLPLDRLSEADRQYVAGKMKPTADLFAVYPEPQPLPSPQQSPIHGVGWLPGCIVIAIQSLLFGTRLWKGEVSIATVGFLCGFYLATAGILVVIFRVWSQFLPDTVGAAGVGKARLSNGLMIAGVLIALAVTVAVTAKTKKSGRFPMPLFPPARAHPAHARHAAR